MSSSSLEPVQPELGSVPRQKNLPFYSGEVTEVSIGGRSAPRRRGLRWAFRQPHGSGIIRLFGYGLRKYATRRG